MPHPEIRAELEGFLLAKAAPRLDAPAFQRLRRICDEAALITDYGHDWVLKNWEFHRALYRPSASREAIAMVEHLALRVERYVRRTGNSRRLDQAVAEHRGIVAEVERGDFAAARARIVEHILHTRERVKVHYSASGATAPRPARHTLKNRNSGNSSISAAAASSIPEIGRSTKMPKEPSEMTKD